jgi:hypothetical protein
MMLRNREILIFFIFLIFAFQFFQFVSAEENLTIQQQAEICLADSRAILNEFIEDNFSYQRINDSLVKAQDLYNAQTLLEENNKSGIDFSLILPYCNDIKQIRELAFEARDEYSSLKKFYDISITSEMDTSEVDIIIAEIESEINSERYEKVSPLIDSAYEKISEVKASYTALNLFYTSTTSSLKRFFQKNWVSIIVVVSILLVLFLIFNRQIKKKIIANKIKNLELRRETLQELIKKTQRDYFQHGKLSEGNYNIRTKKFAEFIRDIDRQIPLLKEESMKISRGKKRNEKIK